MSSQKKSSKNIISTKQSIIDEILEKMEQQLIIMNELKEIGH